MAPKTPLYDRSRYLAWATDPYGGDWRIFVCVLSIVFPPAAAVLALLAWLVG